MTLPVVGITMGDPAGVGPEVIMKALARKDAYALCRPLVIGDSAQLARANALLGLKLRIKPLKDPGEAGFRPGKSTLRRNSSSTSPTGTGSSLIGEFSKPAPLSSVTL